MPREEAEVDERAAAMEAKQDENVRREMRGCGREGREREGRGEREGKRRWGIGLVGCLEGRE